MNRYFITGTDTDCGKTYATRKLIDYCVDSFAIKPVASGCTEVKGQLVNSDALILQQQSPLSLDETNPWRFKSPVSPHIAAKEEGKELSIFELADYCLRVQAPGRKTLFIEGAGGLMVPLNDTHTWIDFLKYTQIPVILIVGMKLGCINHALLTLAALKKHDIFCAGWIANCIDEHMIALSENLNTLKNKLDVPLLAKIPHQGNLLPETESLFINNS